MEFTELIEKRRSIRKYVPGGEPSAEQISEIIAAAQQAPSWKNQQTTRYYVAAEKAAAQRIRECLGKNNVPRSENAALVVTTFVKGNVGFDDDGKPINELGDGWGCYDSGLQAAYFILRACELGFGTLIMGIRDGDALRKVLGIPDGEEITAVLAVGTPDQTPGKPKRLAQEEIIHIAE